MPNRIEKVRVEVRGLIRDKGMRATAARIAVLVALHENEGPMTHEQVMSWLPTGAYDKASVWRVLSDLAGVGVLRRMDLGDRSWRYELHDACRTVTADHPHFLCEECGSVTCLPSLEIRALDGNLPEALLSADYRIRIAGKCGDCAAA